MGNANLDYMKLKLLFVFVTLCISAKSQISEIDLKDFINKNHLALRSVHKHLINQGNNPFESTFRELLQKQEESVKTVNNKSVSFVYAYSVRKECLDFLRKHSKGSLEYFELSASEQKASENLSAIKSILNQEEIDKINALNLKDSQSLNQLSLTIQ